MRPAFFDSPRYKQKQSRIACLNWQKGVYASLNKKEQRKCLNFLCENYFTVSPSDKQKFCSIQCWCLVRRNCREKVALYCTTCGKLITHRNASRFCSLKCQAANNYNRYIQRWKTGSENGNIGISTRFVSRYIMRYLREKYQNKCSLCGWNQRNPVTDKVPLEVDHIDGNSGNNKEENLRLICPNCHSLTPYFRNLNKGNGRAWRLQYLKQLAG